MKSRIVVLIPILGLLFLGSCETFIDEPVDDCSLSVGIDSDAHPLADDLQGVLDDYIANGGPGVSVAIETPDGWWLGCAGMARIEDQTQMKPCHLFHSASVGKPYTATLIMKLQEQGKLDVDDSIRNYLPEEMVSQVCNADVATIRQVMSHTSGIRDYTFYSEERVDVMNNPFEDRTFKSRYEKFVYGLPAKYAPGENFRYSNAGFDMLGLTIEKASGMSFGDYFQQEIIDAIGLSSTYFKSSPGYPEIDGLVNGYIEHYPGELQNCTHIDREMAEMGMGHLGVIANPYEFARFYQELIRGNVLETATLEEMLTVEFVVRENVNMCLGIYYVIDDSHGNRPMYVHNGAVYGMQGQTRYFPDDDITISVQVNTCWIFEEEANHERFLNLREGLLEVIFDD